MKLTIALLVLALVLAPLPTAAQSRAVQSPGPIRKAASAAAARLALEQRPATAPSDWGAVQRIAPRAEIILTATSAQPAARHFVAATDHDVTVLNLTDPTIPATAKVALLDSATRYPLDVATVAKGRRVVMNHNVRLGPDGLFVADAKVADLGEIVETVMRSHVREITTPPRNRGSIPGAVLGTAGGVLLGVVLAISYALKQCGGSCADERLMMILSVTALPVGTGVLGYNLRRQKVVEVIYRAP